MNVGWVVDQKIECREWDTVCCYWVCFRWTCRQGLRVGVLGSNLDVPGSGRPPGKQTELAAGNGVQGTGDSLRLLSMSKGTWKVRKRLGVESYLILTDLSRPGCSWCWQASKKTHRGIRLDSGTQGTGQSSPYLCWGVPQGHMAGRVLVGRGLTWMFLLPQGSS